MNQSLANLRSRLGIKKKKKKLLSVELVLVEPWIALPSPVFWDQLVILFMKSCFSMTRWQNAFQSSCEPKGNTGSVCSFHTELFPSQKFQECHALCACWAVPKVDTFPEIWKNYDLYELTALFWTWSLVTIGMFMSLDVLGEVLTDRDTGKTSNWCKRTAKSQPSSSFLP